MFRICIIILSMITLCGCGKRPTTDAPGQVADKDTAAYNLGIKHGVETGRLLPDTDAVADRLLEIRARQTNIKTNFRNSAAEAYILGVSNGIAKTDSALYNLIFR